MLVRDFERDKHHGRKLDVRWLGLRLLVEISSSEQAGHVQELYSDTTKRYHFDDLKIYCPRDGQHGAATIISRTILSRFDKTYEALEDIVRFR